MRTCLTCAYPHDEEGFSGSYTDPPEPFRVHCDRNPDGDVRCAESCAAYVFRPDEAPDDLPF